MKFVVFSALSFLFANASLSATYNLPSEYFDVVGAPRTVTAKYEDTLLEIALRQSIGQDQMERVNPEVDRWLPGEGTEVLIPSQHVLPPGPRTGLVLNLPEKRMYYYPPRRAGQPMQVQTYPIGIGRMDWGTPLGTTSIVSKVKDPGWRPPESIRREHAAKGDPLPEYVPPGPDNPLGRYAMKLGIPGYLIHSTNKPLGVGMRVSHGCIRMAPDDIEYLFPQVPTGTPVRIINEPVKAGWHGGKLYIEVHPPLPEYPSDRGYMVERVNTVLDGVTAGRSVAVDNTVIEEALTKQTGLPQVITLGG